MLKSFQLLHDLTKRITGTAEEKPAIDIWAYAEPANEETNPLKRNILQWRRLITSVRDPLESFAGQPVDVIGFVHRTPPNIPEQFTLARPVIRCCLADTVPLGLPIHTPNAERYATDTWLRIRGQFGTQQVKGKPTLVVIPTTIKPISKPQKLYINGVF